MTGTEDIAITLLKKFMNGVVYVIGFGIEVNILDFYMIYFLLKST